MSTNEPPSRSSSPSQQTALSEAQRSRPRSRRRTFLRLASLDEVRFSLVLQEQLGTPPALLSPSVASPFVFGELNDCGDGQRSRLKSWNEDMLHRRRETIREGGPGEESRMPEEEDDDSDDIARQEPLHRWLIGDTEDTGDGELDNVDADDDEDKEEVEEEEEGGGVNVSDFEDSLDNSVFSSEDSSWLAGCPHCHTLQSGHVVLMDKDSYSLPPSTAPRTHSPCSLQHPHHPHRQQQHHHHQQQQQQQQQQHQQHHQQQTAIQQQPLSLQAWDQPCSVLRAVRRHFSTSDVLSSAVQQGPTPLCVPDLPWDHPELHATTPQAQGTASLPRAVTGGIRKSFSFFTAGIRGHGIYPSISQL